MAQVQPVAHFVRKHVRPARAAGADAADIIMFHHDTIALRPIVHRAGIVGVAGGAVGGSRYPHVHVAVARPLDQTFHRLIAFEGEHAFRTGDAVGAVTGRIAAGELEAYAHIGYDVQEFRTYGLPVRVQAIEILVQYTHRIDHLLVADV